MIANALETGFIASDGKYDKRPSASRSGRGPYAFDGRIYALPSIGRLC